jgi:multidrug efflux pump subunit AcrA (membrane-fusion protein)
MWKKIRPYLILLAIIIGLIIIVTNIAKSSPKKTPFTPPDIRGGPARVYGTIEPMGSEVYVSPPVTRPVAQVLVQEGDTVKRGQALCVLDNGLEKSQYLAAAARAAALRKTLELSRQDFQVNRSLYENKSISDFDYTRFRLRMELDSLNWVAALRDADLALARLEQLTLRSTVDGRLYKFTVRLGQTLAAGDNSTIILGRPGYQVRLAIESFWADRVDLGDQFDLFDSETGAKVGEGLVSVKARYLGGKTFKTNDLYERFDTKYLEAILVLTPIRDLPIGLPVYAELPGASKKSNP